MDTDALLKRYLPTLWLHPREPCLPFDVKKYLEFCELRLARSEVWQERYWNVKYQVLLGVGQVTCNKLAKFGEHFPVKNLQLVVPKSNRKKLAENSGASQPPPVYAVVKRVMNCAGNLEAYELTYIFFYPFNAPYKLLKWWQVGAHGGDWEHLTVRLYPNGELQGVYYNRHRTYDGDWLPASKVPMQDGRLVTFVAKGAHGCYSKQGVQPRIYYLLNDHCAKGRMWEPSTIVKLVPDYDVPSRGSCLKSDHTFNLHRGENTATMDETTDAPHETEQIKVIQADEWVQYAGYFGTVACPLSDIWCRNAENPVSRGWFKRIFLPLWPGPPSRKTCYSRAPKEGDVQYSCM